MINQGGEKSLIQLSEVPVLEKSQRLSEEAVTALYCWQPRMGEIYTLADPEGRYYRGRLTHLDTTSAVIIPFYAFPHPVETPVSLHVYQALPEKERFELILEKLTELGVDRIIPFVSERSTTLQQRDARQKKSHRWPHVLLRAARQCRRAMIPELSAVMQWYQVIQQLSDSDLTIVLNERENVTGLKEVLKGITSGTISLIVGPEGGLTRHEVDSVCNMGGHAISLGSRILRTETAAILAAGLIQYETGGMGPANQY